MHFDEKTHQFVEETVEKGLHKFTIFIIHETNLLEFLIFCSMQIFVFIQSCLLRVHRKIALLFYTKHVCNKKCKLLIILKRTVKNELIICVLDANQIETSIQKIKDQGENKFKVNDQICLDTSEIRKSIETSHGKKAEEKG